MEFAVEGQWATKRVWINGREVTVRQFRRDLARDIRENDDDGNYDLIDALKGVAAFDWGSHSRGKDALMLACCYYWQVSYVLTYFLTNVLAELPRNDFRMGYSLEFLDAKYQDCNEEFIREFTAVMTASGYQVNVK